MFPLPSGRSNSPIDPNAPLEQTIEIECQESASSHLSGSNSHGGSQQQRAPINAGGLFQSNHFKFAAVTTSTKSPHHGNTKSAEATLQQERGCRGGGCDDQQRESLEQQLEDLEEGAVRTNPFWIAGEEPRSWQGGESAKQQGCQADWFERIKVSLPCL